jgi:hypothetical protein
VEKTGAPGERPLDCWARFRVGHKPCLVGRVGRHVALGDGVWLVTRRTLEIADGVAMTVTDSGRERRYRLGAPMLGGVCSPVPSWPSKRRSGACSPASTTS